MHAGATPAVTVESTRKRAPFFIGHAALLLLQERFSASTTAQVPASQQPYLAALCKMQRAVVRILNVDAHLQRETTSYGRYCIYASAARNCRDRRSWCKKHSCGHFNQRARFPILQLNKSRPHFITEHQRSRNEARLFCYASALRSAGAKQNTSYQYLVRAA